MLKLVELVGPSIVVGQVEAGGSSGWGRNNSNSPVLTQLQVRLWSSRATL